MSSVEGDDAMGEHSRREALLTAPVGRRVEHFFDVLERYQRGTMESEDERAEARLELYVFGAGIAAEVLTALVVVANALDSLAQDARAGAGSVNPLTNFGEKR